jgi:hypothetical protein
VFRHAAIIISVSVALASCGGSSSTKAASPSSTTPVVSVTTVATTAKAATSAPTTAAVPTSTNAPTSASIATTAPKTTIAVATTTAQVSPPVGEDIAAQGVEDALTAATGCGINQKFGRKVSAIQFLLTGIGPSGVDRPHEPIDGSFTCESNPIGVQQFGAARFSDAAQAAATADWFTKSERCRPVAVAGSWMLVAARAPTQPQASDDFEKAVAALNGTMTATCR